MATRRSSLTFVLPVTVCIVFLGSELMSRILSDQTSAQTLRQHVAQIDIMGGVVHELQRERGLSSGVLASDARIMVDDLGEQRLRTDAAVSSLRTTWGLSDLSVRQSSIMQTLLQVRRLRQGTDTQQMTNMDVVARYTAIVNELLEASIVAPPMMTTRTRLNLFTNALHEVSLAKEAAGLQRATGAAILAHPDGAEELRMDFISYGAQERAFLDLAAIHLGESRNLEFLDPLVSNHPVAAYRTEIVALGRGPAGVTQITAEDWFTTSTEWIDQLRRIEQALQSVINETANELESKVRSEMVWNGLTVGVALLVLAFQILISPASSNRETELENAAV